MGRMGRGGNFVPCCLSEIQSVLSLTSLNTNMTSLVTVDFGHLGCKTEEVKFKIIQNQRFRIIYNILVHIKVATIQSQSQILLKGVWEMLRYMPRGEGNRFFKQNRHSLLQSTLPVTKYPSHSYSYTLEDIHLSSSEGKHKVLSGHFSQLNVENL